jgi:hypothetical protein
MFRYGAVCFKVTKGDDCAPGDQLIAGGGYPLRASDTFGLVELAEREKPAVEAR